MSKMGYGPGGEKYGERVEIPERGRYMGTCGWVEEDGVWSTDCKNAFEITEGTPEENGMKFCCYCGKRIAQFPDEEC